MSDGNSRLNLAGHHDESLLDVLAILSRSLKEADVVVLGEFLALVGGDLAGVGHVALVADQDAGDVVAGVLLDFVHPVFDGGETLAVRDVVGDDDAVRALVVAAGDGLEALLAGRVPDLQLDRLAVDLDRADLEVDADGRHEVVCEHVVRESQQQRGLADAGVADQQHFEQVVAIFGLHGGQDTYYSGFILDYYLNYKRVTH